MHKNKFIITAVLLIAVIGIILVYQNFDAQNNQIVSSGRILSNTNITVDNWKTYKNTEYDYEIKYPSDWLTFDSSNNITYALHEYNITPKYDQEKFFGAPNLLQIIVFRGDMDSYLKSHNGFKSEENFIFNGYNAKKLIFANLKYPIQYAIEHNGKVFVINVQVATNYDTGVTEDDANRVISTFRFIE